MIFVQNVPKYLWPTAVTHAAYVQNVAWTQSLDKETPEGLWSGKHLNMAHLQEYRVPVWILRLGEGENISKLDPCSTKHTFVGFADGPLESTRKSQRKKTIHAYHTLREDT